MAAPATAPVDSRVVDSRLVILDSPGRADVTPTAIGAKAADLVRLIDAGLPVPPAFVLSTEVCSDWHGGKGDLEPMLAKGVSSLEKSTGCRFGAPRHPLLVSVRSGAAVSMPGMLDTVLDIGLSDATLPGLLLSTGDPTFAWDSYRRLILAFAEVVEGLPGQPFEDAVSDALDRRGVPDIGELDVTGQKELIKQLEGLYRDLSGHSFPQKPDEQLLQSVEAVLRSWNSERAIEYRRIQGLSDLAGTAVTVQAMVFGNLGASSGSGVAFTRNPATGADELYVDFLINAQGEDVVSGRRSVSGHTGIEAVPGLSHELETVRHRLEDLFRDAQDFEFTVEDGKLWLLQTRTAKRTPLAALQIACDMVDQGLIDEATALERLSPYDLDTITTTSLEIGADTEAIGQAVPASGGVASGRVCLDVVTAMRTAEDGSPVILVRDHASTGDIAALAVSRGLLTAKGSRTSHAAVVARHLALVCLTGCGELSIDHDGRDLRIGGHHLNEGDTITLDGTTGNIYTGELRPVSRRPTQLIDRVHSWETP